MSLDLGTGVTIDVAGVALSQKYIVAVLLGIAICEDLLLQTSVSLPSWISVYCFPRGDFHICIPIVGREKLGPLGAFVEIADTESQTTR